MTRPEEFVVKHYVSDEHPSLKGMGHDVFVAEDREDVQALADTLNAELDQLRSELEFVRKAFPGAVQEAYESGFYEGAGGDAWHSDHDDEGNLTPDACVRKPLAEYMREVHEVDVTLTGGEDSDES